MWRLHVVAFPGIVQMKQIGGTPYYLNVGTQGDDRYGGSDPGISPDTNPSLVPDAAQSISPSEMFGAPSTDGTTPAAGVSRSVLAMTLADQADFRGGVPGDYQETVYAQVLVPPGGAGKTFSVVLDYFLLGGVDANSSPITVGRLLTPAGAVVTTAMTETSVALPGSAATGALQKVTLLTGITGGAENDLLTIAITRYKSGVTDMLPRTIGVAGVSIRYA